MKLINPSDNSLTIQELDIDTLINLNKPLSQSGKMIMRPSNPLQLNGEKGNVLSVKSPRSLVTTKSANLRLRYTQ
jgi:hypothetical protein